MTATFDQPDVNLARQPKLNIALLQILKQNWGARDVGEPPFKYTMNVKFGGANAWYDQGQTPALIIHPVSKKVERMGIGSSQRYHHSLHRVYLFCRHPDERDECVLEIERILQKFATQPMPGILRIDYYSETAWQQESPIGVLFRQAVDVVMIYVK